MKRNLSWLVFILMALMMIGCSSDSNGTNTVTNADDTYAYPKPTIMLLGATHFQANSTGTSWLYEIDTSNGSAQLIGDIGYVVNGMAYNANTKKLYATTGNKDQNLPSGLIEINMKTGAGTPIGDGTGFLTNCPTFNSNGVLFAWQEDDDALCTIDVHTGVATSFPNMGMNSYEQGLSFDNNDVLFFINGDANVYIMNQGTGDAELVGQLKERPYDVAHHGKFHPQTGQFWALDNTNYYSTTRSLLIYNIHRFTLLKTIPTIDSLHVIEFVEK